MCPGGGGWERRPPGLGSLWGGMGTGVDVQEGKGQAWEDTGLHPRPAALAIAWPALSCGCPPSAWAGAWALWEEWGSNSPCGGLVRWAGAGLDLLGDQPLMAQQNRLAEPASPLMGLGQREGLLVERTKRPSKSFSGLPKAPAWCLQGRHACVGLNTDRSLREGHRARVGVEAGAGQAG